jgi:hypothetical protein
MERKNPETAFPATAICRSLAKLACSACSLDTTLDFLAGERDADLVVLQSASLEAPVAVVQAQLRTPGDRVGSRGAVAPDAAAELG